MSSLNPPPLAPRHLILYVVVGIGFIAVVACLSWWSRTHETPLPREAPVRADATPFSAPSHVSPPQPASVTPAIPPVVGAADTAAHPGPGGSPSIPSPSASAASTAPRPSNAPPTAYARITLASGRVLEQPSDVSGRFERVPVACGETVTATLRLPSAKPGDPVVFGVEDGGVLSGETMADAQPLKADLTAGFTFRVSVQTGVHRVTAQHAGHFYVYDFWAEPTQAASRF